MTSCVRRLVTNASIPRPDRGAPTSEAPHRGARGANGPILEEHAH
eukprot:CAMPEP_0179169602 /NCGR_PEP_ID=MMETSP0796-20121207/83500_1 /TAXON_ID=73915 /ORGANISM="Pyrodinium bahamense, Strain pbaha01" /LENGTH=44 /DNA_ID= /DNA_START= /DNA_END= /DNA_ORIENTATION=